MSAIEDLNDALDLLERAGFELQPVVAALRWRWREEPFGVCQRCYWDAHTLGPDGKPWHAFCWGNEIPPTSFDQWLLRKWLEQEQERDR